MNQVSNSTLLLVAVIAAELTACAATLPPKDLVNARDAYQEAKTGTTQRLNPADLNDAKTQLDVAEATFAEEGDTQNARDQAYLAARKTELATVIARTRRANDSTDAVVATMHEDERSAADRISAEGLGLTRPIANNDSPEGRANNRRVEIVVQPAK